MGRRDDMNEINENPSSARKCPRCGAELPASLPPELCPKCLLKTGMEPGAAAGPNGTVVVPKSDAGSRGLPQAGEQVGNYRIIRPLGKGGMGAVFEVEDLESGRRVALKVLSHTLDSPEARERFFREGRLAASINHPNSVYIFGTGEIVGTPFIAMELVAGGTLQDRVRAGGPLPTSEAVDAVLQIIAGLEAARRIGILHRDVKPSNCFLDAEGTVKIGDFGLSISTAIRTEPALTASGEFLGTPAFCSPEQLRGEELNARSDMYSVGATLFYLLTGRTPFEAKNVVRLLATVLEQRAPSPRKFRPEIPSGLSKVILRCLEKQAGDRFKNYDELQQALAPYGSTAPTPATLGLRFLAGTLDMVFLCLVSGTVTVARFGDPLELMNRMSQRMSELLPWMLGWFCVTVLYYGLAEGIWGATPGKLICRLRVVGPDNSPPGVLRGLVRSLFYVVLPVLPYWIASGGDPMASLRWPTAGQYIMQFSFYGVMALLFCTVRRRNGFAAVHDLVTRTRVILRTAIQARTVPTPGERPPAAVETRPRVGPYHVLEPLGKSGGMEWLLGYDLRLLRKVWLRVVPPGTPPVPVPWRNIGRAGRLRWLAGRRTPEENWDAFEGITGQPLVKLASTPQPWSDVRYWLHDLASEISAAEKDGSLPSVLALDRVWITGDGRAKLLDFPAPGIEQFPDRSGEPPIAATRFLDEVAAAALGGGANAALQAADQVNVPLPLHARAFLSGLPKLSDAAAVNAGIRPLLSRLAAITRKRRAAVVAGCIAFPLVVAVGSIFGSAMLQRWNQTNPGLMDLSSLLQQHSMMNRFRRSASVPDDEQYAVYIAGHYRSIITNEAAWSSPFALALIRGDARRFAEQCVADHPAPTEKEIADAETALKPYGLQSKFPDFSRQAGFPLMVPAMVAGISLVFYVFIPALLAALLFRGGLVLRITNVTFVRRDGRRASRLRVFWRVLVAWSLVGLAMCLAGGLGVTLGRGHPVLSQTLAYVVVCGLAILSAALPGRGLPDRLAGTWPVPR
jgi:eukaryotic-like serine/threonine-protein kinase